MFTFTFLRITHLDRIKKDHELVEDVDTSEESKHSHNNYSLVKVIKTKSLVFAVRQSKEIVRINVIVT